MKLIPHKHQMSQNKLVLVVEWKSGPLMLRACSFGVCYSVFELYHIVFMIILTCSFKICLNVSWITFFSGRFLAGHFFSIFKYVPSFLAYSLSFPFFLHFLSFFLNFLLFFQWEILLCAS